MYLLNTIEETCVFKFRNKYFRAHKNIDQYQSAFEATRDKAIGLRACIETPAIESAEH